MSVFELKQGSSPVILGFPHTGTDVPADVWERMNDNGRMLADTDWHIERLYDGLLPNATTVRAILSCQPCLRGSKATQTSPANSGVVDTK